MHHRIQQKELKIEEMTSKVEDLEKRVEAMEEFEKSLVKTMVNLDMKEIMEVVKEQRERILGLETKLREKEKELEQAEALLEDKHFEKEEEKVTPAVLRPRGINVTLAREDEVKEATKTIEGVETPRRMENGGGKLSAPLASVLRANTGLIIQRPAGGDEQRRESDDENNSPSISEQPGPSSENMADLLEARGVTFQRYMSTSSSAQGQAASEAEHLGTQRDEIPTGIEDEEEEAEADVEEASLKRRPNSSLGNEKEGWKEKRMKKLEGEDDGDSFWFSAPPESMIDDDDDPDETLDHDNIELSSGTKSWLRNGVLVKEWTEDGRRVLEWEGDGWRGECPDCLQKIVHVCPDDAIFLELFSEY